MARRSDIVDLLNYIDGKVDSLNAVSVTIQKKIYDIVLSELMKFDQSDGRFLPSENMNSRLIDVQKKIESVLDMKIWRDAITDFLPVYQTIEERNIQLQRDFNQLKVATELLSPTRKFIYNQAKYKLTTSVRTEYIEPVKFLLMQQVTGGSSINDALKMLERWNDGQLSQGKYTTNNPAPNLQKYATQIARDTAYSTDRTMNGIIKDRYQLDGFIYVGGIISDTRPLCAYLVSQPQPVPFKGLSQAITAYPDGLIAGTNEKNFIEYCGGYNCRHKAFPLKLKS